MFHDVGWPHARRDDYFAPEQIPDEYRQPTIEGGGLFPGLSAPQPGGLPYKWPAANEGGPRNGVLTAVEDFVASDEHLRLAIMPSFFGLGVVWDTRAAYSERLANRWLRWTAIRSSPAWRPTGPFIWLPCTTS